MMQLRSNQLEKKLQENQKDLLFNFKRMFTNESKHCVHQQWPEWNQPFFKPTEEPWS